MAYRGGRGGRGRGRGGFGGGEFRSTPEPFVIYPEITLPNPKSISIDNKLLESYSNFQKFWKTSPYHIGDGVSKQKKESLDIERFSDSSKPKKKSNKTGSFYDFLVLRPDNFPKELLGETRRERPVKRARWTQDADLQKLDLFEKLEAKYKAAGKEDNPEGEDDNEEKEKKKKMKMTTMMIRNLKYQYHLVVIMIRMKTLMMMTTIITRRKMLIVVNHCIIKKKFLVSDKLKPL